MSTSRPSSLRKKEPSDLDQPPDSVPASSRTQQHDTPAPDPPELDAEPSPSHDADNADPEPHDDQEIPYPELSPEQTLLPPPNFKPFFTIIEDSTSGEHYHPYVHYVFADDDPVIMTAASMRSLGLDDTQFLSQQHAPDRDPERFDGDGSGGLENEPAEDGPIESPLPPPIPGVKERYLIVDIAADGHTVLDAQSLSSEWQVTGANMRAAPTFHDEEADHAFMIRVEGVEVPPKSKGKVKGEPGDAKLKKAMENAQGNAFKAMDALVAGVEGGLDIAGKIMGGQGSRGGEKTVGVAETGATGVVAEGKGKERAQMAGED